MVKVLGEKKVVVWKINISRWFDIIFISGGGIFYNIF